MSAILGIDLGSSACRVVALRDGRLEPVRLHGEATLPLREIKRALLNGERAGSAKQTTLCLQWVREAATAAAGLEFDRAVIAAPTAVTDRSRALLRNAAFAADFGGVRLLDEAVALVLGSAEPLARGSFLIFSAGAGPFSATVVAIAEGVTRVIAHESDAALCGEAFDRIVANLLLREPAVQDAVRGLDSGASLRRLCANVKLKLSRHDFAEIELEAQNGRVVTLRRAEFEAAMAETVQRCVVLAQSAVEAAGMTVAELAGLTLHGGSTFIPLLAERLCAAFPLPIIRATEMDIARGAAVLGGQLRETDWKRPEAQVTPPDPPPPRSAPRVTEAPKATGAWQALFTESLAEAEALWNQGQRHASIERYKDFLDSGQDYFVTLCQQAGQEFLRDQKYAEAVIVLDEARRVSPEDSKIFQTLHEAQHLLIGQLQKEARWREAKEAAGPAIRLHPYCKICRELGEINRLGAKGRWTPEQRKRK